MPAASCCQSSLSAERPLQIHPGRQSISSTCRPNPWMSTLDQYYTIALCILPRCPSNLDAPCSDPTEKWLKFGVHLTLHSFRDSSSRRGKVGSSTILLHPAFRSLNYIEARALLSVCARQARCSILQNSGRLVAYPCRVVSPCQQSSAGLAWFSLAQDHHISGRHESGIRTVPLPRTLAYAAPR